MNTITTYKKRLNKYDNLKGLAIIFVVFIHMSNPFSHFPIRNDITLLITPLSMSIFFFVSGYFTKVDENTQIKAFKKILVPFIIFTATWIIYSVLLFGTNIPKLPYLVPTAGLWFLLALFWLRSFLPILVRIKYIFVISLILALLVGLITFPKDMGDFLTIGRTFGYLPIFLVGYYFKNNEEYFQSFGSTLGSKIKPIFFKISKFLKENKKIVFIILIGILISLFILYQHVPVSFLEYKRSYINFDYGRKIGMLIRLFVILASITLVLLITYLMTNKKTFLTKLGMNSLSIYILHFYFSSFSSRIFLKTGIGSTILHDPYLAIIYSVLLSAFVLFILSRDIVEKNMRKLIEVVGNFLMKDEAPKQRIE